MLGKIREMAYGSSKHLIIFVSEDILRVGSESCLNFWHELHNSSLSAIVHT